MFPIDVTKEETMKKQLVALWMSVVMALSAPAFSAMPTVEARALSMGGAKATRQDLSFSHELDNGDPWLDTDFKENIKKGMAADPVEDFHFYANKSWLLKNDIPEGSSIWSRYSECAQNVTERCIGLLEDDSAQGYDAQLVKSLYHSILDWDARDAAGVSELKGLTDQILCVTDMEAMKGLLLSQKGIELLDSLVSFDVDSGINDSMSYVAYIGRTGFLALGDPAEYFHRTEMGESLYRYKKEVFVHVAERLGMSKEEAAARFDGAIDFEKKLAEECMTSEEGMDSDSINQVNNELTYADLGVFGSAYPLTQMVDAYGLRYDGKYIVSEPDYLHRLNAVFTQENLEGIKDHLLVGYVFDYTSLLDTDILNFNADTYSKYFGGEGGVSEEEFACDMVMDMLPVSMQKLYVERYGSLEDKRQVEDICHKVIDTYREMLRDNKWASRTTIENAIKKLDAMKINVGYPDQWEDTSGINIQDKSLIGSYLEIAKADYDSRLARLGKQVDDTNWAMDMNTLDCNAFYSVSDNSINILFGMMGEPFYKRNMPKEEIYASLGAFWIGHEISHAFDAYGSQFDANGNLSNWWAPSDLQKFKVRVRKMERYLNKIVPFDDYHVNGGNIDTEVVADMTGLQCALRMAEKEKKFDYEKFFKTYAQMNASLSNYSSEVYLLTQDTHPLDYLRTNVPVQQFDEFYKTFHVTPGDGMYLAPKDRLLIW